MARVRNLTEVEKFYIENNQDKSDAELSAKMSGIGEKSVAKFRATIEPKQKEKESDEERIDRLASGPEAGNFISKRSGSVAMTQQASEVSDAKRIKSDNSNEHEKRNRNSIHRPQG
jgi:hypothetical protein